MKKIFYYLGAGVIILGLIGFWLYSFLYGSPNNATPQFANFDLFGNETVVPEVVPPVTIAPPVVDVALAKLRQLTTKPVIGMRIITRGNSTLMRYVEAGTGQVFDIDLKTGTETRVSPISVPLANEAKVSPSGRYVAIGSGIQTGNDVVVINLPETGTTPTKQNLPVSVANFDFGQDDVLFYSTVIRSTLEGRSYLPSTLETTKLFSVPFTAATVLWSNHASTSHYVLTKPANNLTSYLYEVKTGSLMRTPISGRGLTVLPYKDSILFSVILAIDNADRLALYRYNITQKKTEGLVVGALAEKCISETIGTDIYCGANLDTPGSGLPDNWYKGLITFDDRIWKTSQSGASSQIANLRALSGRPIDIYKPQLTNNSEMLYFINKTDQSLWLYEL